MKDKPMAELKELERQAWLAGNAREAQLLRALIDLREELALFRRNATY